MVKAKELPSGSWNILLYDGKDEHKKRVYKSFTANTKTEVEYMAANYALNKNHIRSPENFTLADAYERYISSKSNILSPSTVREYKRSWKSDLQGIMTVKLKDLTQERIQIEINKESCNHAPKSVRNMHGLLSAVLSVYAPSLKLSTGLPQKIDSDVFVPGDQHIKKLLEATKNTPLHTAILLAATGSLRRSEICALQSDDVTETGVNVNKAMVKNDNKEWVIKTTKTTSGKRFVELPGEVIEELKSIDGKIYPYLPGSITNLFRVTTARLFGTSFRFHDLRHYSASVLHALGIPDIYIMARGGWKSRTTLNRVYTHVMTEEQKTFNQAIITRFNSVISTQMQDEKQDES